MSSGEGRLKVAVADIDQQTFASGVIELARDIADLKPRLKARLSRS